MIIKRTKQLGNFKRGINLYIPKRISSAPVGIPVASTNTIILNNALAFYQSSLGQAYFISNQQYFGKINSTTYNDGGSNYILFSDHWIWRWDNNDNSYELIDMTNSTNPNFIPTDWGNGITITAA